MPSLPALFCGAAIAAVVAGRTLYQLGPYVAGRRGHDALVQQYEFAWMMLMGVCFGISFLASIALGLVLIYRLLPGQMDRKKSLWQVVVLVGWIAIVLGLCVVTLRPAHEYFLEGFKGYLGERADIPAIQKWSYGLGFGDKAVPNSDWPSSVEILSPEGVSVEGIGENRQVTLAWGGGFMHWGLTLRENPVRPSCVPWRWVVDLDGVSFVWMDDQ